MACGVYGIFDSVNSTCLYIGQSKFIEVRWKQHLKLLRNKNHPRQDFVDWWIENGGEDSTIVFRILETCDINDELLNRAEIKWFNQLTPIFYGKRPALTETWAHSDLTKEKIRNSLSNTFHSDVQKKRKNLVEHKEEIVKLATSRRMTLRQAANFYNVSVSVFKQFAKENGISWLSLRKAKDGSVVVYDDYPILEWFFQDLLSQHEIARRLNVCCHGVSKYIRASGDPRVSQIERRMHPSKMNFDKEII